MCGTNSVFMYDVHINVIFGRLNKYLVWAISLQRSIVYEDEFYVTQSDTVYVHTGASKNAI